LRTIVGGQLKSRLKADSGEIAFNDESADINFRVESDGNDNMFRVDAGLNRVAIGNSTPSATLHVSSSDTSVALLDSDNSAGSSLFIRNSTIATDTYASLGFAPANNVSGATITAIAEEDFSDAASRTARLEFHTRDNGNFLDRLTLSRAEAVFNEDSDNTDFRVESDSNSNMLFVDASANKVGINNNAPAAFLHVASGDATPLGSLRVEQTNASAGGAIWQSLFEDDSSADQGSGNSLIYINSNRPNTSAGQVLKVVGNSKASNYFNIYDTGEVVVNDSSVSTADFLVESDSSTHMLFVNAGTNRVGIGESNPDNTLHVNSGAENTAFKLQSTDTEVAMQFQDSTGASYIKGRGDLRFEVGAADVVQMLSGETVVNNSSNDYDFRVESNDNTHALFVDAGNNRVGILNSSPSYEFDVTGTISASDGVLANKAALNISRGTFDGGSSNSDNMGLRVIGTGNDNVTGNLQTGIAIGEGGAGLFSFDEGGSAAVGLGFYTGTNSAVYERMVIKADGNGIIINDQSHDQDFRVESDGNSHMLFVDASGNFFAVNATTNTFASKSGTFAVASGSNSTATPVAIITDEDATVEGGSTILSLTFSGDDTFSSANYIHFTDSGGEQGRIHSTGGGSVTYATTSDRRVKENIRDTSSKIDDLKAIQVRDYELISDGSSHTGFIAQELHTVVPDAVSVGGDDVKENRWGVEYGKVTPILVKALQEAIAKIEDLETRLAALEAN